MADVTRTIGATTGDEATIGDAITWGQNSANYDRSGSDDVLILEIVDAEAFNEIFRVDAFTGTPTSSKYCLFTAAAAVRHEGKYDETKALIKKTNGADPTPHEFSEDYVHVKWCQFSTSAGNSFETPFRFHNVSSNIITDCIIEKCVVRADHTNVGSLVGSRLESCDAMYAFDLVIDGGGYTTNNPYGIVADHTSGTNDVSIHVEHCTIYNVGYRGMQFLAPASGTHVLGVYNNVVVESSNVDYAADADWDTENGEGNISSDGTATSVWGSGNGNTNDVTVTDIDHASPNSIHYVQSIAGSPEFSEDLQLLEAVNGDNAARANAQTGATRDSRIDITVDCAGNPRPATFTDRDCGALQVIAAPSVGNLMLMGMGA